MQSFSAPPVARAFLTTWLGCAAVLAAQTAVTLDPKTVKWSVDGKEVPVRGVISPVTEGVLRGGSCIGSDEQGNLVATDERGGREVWRVKAEKGRALMPVYLTDDAVFFQTWTRPAKESDPETKEWLTTTRGTYDAAITRLEQDGDTLVLTIATESGSNIRVMVPAL